MFYVIKEMIYMVVLTIVLAFTFYVLGAEVARAESIKVAVIDAGFKGQYKDMVKLCKEDHASFTDSSPLTDTHGHGTNIAGLINDNAGDSGYCLMILKYFANNTNNMDNSLHALRYAILNRVNIINYSGGGPVKSDVECSLVVKFLDMGGILVAAAGNEGKDMKLQNYYPAMCDKRVIVVGNLNEDGSRAPSSNYGEPVDVEVVGTNRKSLNIKLTGTSQSTAIVTGKIVKQLYLRKILKHTPEFFGDVTTDNYLFEYETFMAR